MVETCHGTSDTSVMRGSFFSHESKLGYHTLVVCLLLCNSVVAGEEIEVTGIYSHSYDLGLSQKSGFPVFGTLIEANYIQKRQDQFSVHRLTDDDRREILALGRDPQVRTALGEESFVRPTTVTNVTNHKCWAEICKEIEKRHEICKENFRNGFGYLLPGGKEKMWTRGLATIGQAVVVP